MGEKFLKWLDDAGFEIALFIAGFVGAMSNNMNQKLPRWQRVFAFLSGGAIAMYLTPLLYIYLSINENAKYGIGFLMGFAGMEGVKLMLIKFKDVFNKKQD